MQAARRSPVSPASAVAVPASRRSHDRAAEAHTLAYFITGVHGLPFNSRRHLMVIIKMTVIFLLFFSLIFTHFHYDYLTGSSRIQY